VLAYGTPESEAERVPGDLPAPILSSKEMTMRSVLLTRYAPLLAAALVVAYLPSAGAQAGTAPSGGPMRARITGAAIPYTSHATTGSKAARRACRPASSRSRC
jgi:hypothetical protein